MIELQPDIIHRMCELCRLLVLLPNFDSLVALARDKSDARMVESGCENASLSRNRTRLHLALNFLEIVARLPVPKVQTAVIRAYPCEPQD